MPETQKDQFVAESERSRRSLAGEMWDLLRDNKKWWMVPLILVVALLAGLMVLSSTAAAPFIYTLF